jgi:hypothetical protein
VLGFSEREGDAVVPQGGFAFFRSEFLKVESWFNMFFHVAILSR